MTVSVVILSALILSAIATTLIWYSLHRKRGMLKVCSGFKKQYHANINIQRPLLLIISLTVSLGITYGAVGLTLERLIHFKSQNEIIFQPDDEHLMELHLPQAKLSKPKLEPEQPHYQETKLPLLDQNTEQIIDTISVDLTQFTELAAGFEATPEKTSEFNTLSRPFFAGDSELTTNPEFPGGLKAFYQFISNNYNYPQEARKNRTTDTLKISFVIDQNGQLTETTIIHGNHKSLNNEAERVLQSSPRWKPGYVDDIPVKVQYMIPLNIK